MGSSLVGFEIEVNEPQTGYLLQGIVVGEFQGRGGQTIILVRVDYVNAGANKTWKGTIPMQGHVFRMPAGDVTTWTEPTEWTAG